MTDHTPAHDDTPAEPGSWLRLPEAATCLHVNLRTVHAYINDGKLTKRKLPRGRSEVWVPERLIPEEPPESTLATAQASMRADLSQHMALMERLGEISAQQMAPLVEELARTRQQMSAQAEELGKLRAELEAARARRSWWPWK